MDLKNAKLIRSNRARNAFYKSTLHGRRDL